MRQLLAIIALVFSATVHAQDATTLLSAATTTGASTKVGVEAPLRAYYANGTTSAGSGSATIKIEGTNVTAPTLDDEWVTLGTITLTLGTTVTADGFVSQAPWRWIRANVTAISGTGASVNVYFKAR